MKRENSRVRQIGGASLSSNVSRIAAQTILLLVAIAHYAFFALVSYAETGRVGGDCFNHFVYPFRSSIGR
jgi:hypothetical protein